MDPASIPFCGPEVRNTKPPSFIIRCLALSSKLYLLVMHPMLSSPLKQGCGTMKVLLLLLGGILGVLLQGEASATGLPRRLYSQTLSGEPPKSAVVLWSRGYYTYSSG
jgi:hypothetical protein